MGTRFESRYKPRVAPRRPIRAFVAAGPAEILNVSESGIAIRHDAPMKAGTETLVEFEWGTSRLVLRCLVIHSVPLITGGYRSGLTLARVDGPAAEYRRRVAAAIEWIRSAEDSR